MKKDIFKTPITRRNLLNGISSSTLAILLRPLHRAFAQDASACGKYFVNFFIGNGVNVDAYPSNDQGNIVVPLTKDLLSFDANGQERYGGPGYIFNPLSTEGLLDKAIICQGLTYERVNTLLPQSFNPHPRGTLSALSAGSVQGDGRTWTEPTIEHIVYQKQGKSFPFGGPILVNCDSTAKLRNLTTNISWGYDRRPVGLVNGPQRAFRTIFGNFDAEANNGTNSGEKRQGRIKAIIDANFAQIKSLQKVVGSEGKEMIDAHLQYLSDIEKKFSALADEVKVCKNPALQEENDYFSGVEDMMGILLATLQCGISNVAMCLLQGSGSDINYARQIGMNGTFQHHDCSHSASGSKFEALTRINHWGISAVARFAKALDSIPDCNGTMLDNSVISVSQELGRGRSHEIFNASSVILGGAGGKYKTGQYIKFGNKNGSDGKCVSELLLSHCRAMGIEEQTVQIVGDRQIATGDVIKELFA